MAIYILNSAQISAQSALDDGWADGATVPVELYRRSVDADYKLFIAPMALRRMGKILRRAIAVSQTVADGSGINDPDAIICGTGLGCIENTEHFLAAMVNEGESCLQPTYFINSTHNTISSQVAAFMHCHGYNSTYAHLGVSFDSALLDAVMQFETGAVHSALVGGHDEMTPQYFKLLDRIGYWKHGEVTNDDLRLSVGQGSVAGETAVAFMLGDKDESKVRVVLRDVAVVYRPESLECAVNDFLMRNSLSAADIDVLVTGRNGDCRYDCSYRELEQGAFGGANTVWYKHLFGESFTASAFGLYVGQKIIREQRIADVLLFEKRRSVKAIDNVLLVNGFEGRDYSFVLLSRE